MNSRDRIIDAACSAIAADGLSDLTVAAVARRAGISTALVHYHFSTKQLLIEAAGERLATRRAEVRGAALARAHGLDALDALWDELELGAASGAERACGDLALLARTDGTLRTILAARRRDEQRALAERLPTLLGELGASPPVPADEAATLVLLFLDGAALALAGGEATEDIRAVYDAFWLVLVKAGPPARPH